MSKAPRRPGLVKTFVARQRGYHIDTVNAFGVRELTRHDEEFTNFAIHADFPSLVPRHEIWIDARLFESEGLFFLANALTRLSACERGLDDDRAYKLGLAAERALRERLLGLKYRAEWPHRRVPARIYAGSYATIPDAGSPVEIRLVEGNLVRSIYRIEYTEGGHGYVYRWVPKREIWVEKDIEARELPFIVAHEYTERRLMRDRGMEYAPAHRIAAKVEFALREGDRLRDLVGPSGREFSKAHLPLLATEEFFAAVRREYRC
jgi:hypothetical protein